MNRKKKVTPAVFAANKKNAQKSTGPNTDRGKATSRMNAVIHGLNASAATEDRGDAAPGLPELEEWRRAYNPCGIWEETLVKEIASQQRKLAILEKLENAELADFEIQVKSDNVSGIDSVFNNELRLPVEGMDLPIQRGWDCERLVIRASSIEDKDYADGSNGPVIKKGQLFRGHKGFSAAHNNTGRRLEIEATMTPTLARIVRYRAAIKKDLYRAVDALLASQTRRLEEEAVLGRNLRLSF